MTPLLIAGAATALSLAKDIFSSKSPAAAQANAGQTAKNAAGKFDEVLQTQTALNAQKAKAEMEAKLNTPMAPEAQTVALEAFNARQENIADRVQKGLASGQLTSTEGDAVKSLQATAQADLDKAMADGVLTVGEFRQVNASLDAVSRQVASYRINQQMGASQAASGYSPFSATV